MIEPEVLYEWIDQGEKDSDWQWPCRIIATESGGMRAEHQPYRERWTWDDSVEREVIAELVRLAEKVEAAHRALSPIASWSLALGAEKAIREALAILDDGAKES